MTRYTGLNSQDMFAWLVILAIVLALLPIAPFTAHAAEVTCLLTVDQAYRSPASSAVWFVTKNPNAANPNVCYKRAFSHANTFFTYFRSWDVVKDTTQGTLDSIAQDPLGFMPKGPLYDPQYGALVKHPFDPRVFLILGTEKYWITSEDVFNALGYKWNWIEDVDPAFLDKYTLGSEINYTNHHPNYTLIKYANSPYVYRLEPDPDNPTQQIRRYVPNEAAFRALNFRFDRVVEIDTDETYGSGNPLSAPGGGGIFLSPL